VNHGTSHGLKAPPKFYRPQVVGFRPVDVASIDFSPFGEPIFLVRSVLLRLMYLRFMLCAFVHARVYVNVLRMICVCVLLCVPGGLWGWQCQTTHSAE
jgi:hypothetical protein